MAHSTQSQSEEVMVSWQSMRNSWIRQAFQNSKEKGESVKSYLNNFVYTENKRGFSFTITQLYDELFQLCITTEQYLNIKRKLEKHAEIELPEARSHELLSGGARKQKSFSTAHEIRQFCEKDLPRLNKPIIIRKHDEALDHFTKVRNAFSIKDPKEFLAFDIEVYEHDHSQILEIGYVIVRFSPARPQTEGNLPKAEVTSRKHLIIEENLHFKNKDNVPDNRGRFVFGVSETLSMADAIKRFREDVIECDYILGHSVKHDDAYLRDRGVDLRELGKEMLDTQVVQIYKESLKESEKYFMRGLSYLLREYGLNYEDSHLHNAGCDAFYTMMVFLRQMGYSAEQVNASYHRILK